MFDVALHTGSQHPNLLWVVVGSLLSFALGLGIGRLGGSAAGLFGSLRRAVGAESEE